MEPFSLPLVRRVSPVATKTAPNASFDEFLEASLDKQNVGDHQTSPSLRDVFSHERVAAALMDARPRRFRDWSNSIVTESQDRFEIHLKKYYYQLSRGCGRRQCPNKFCASSSIGSTLAPPVLLILSIYLASRSAVHLCLPVEFDVSTVRLPNSVLHRGDLSSSFLLSMLSTHTFRRVFDKPLKSAASDPDMLSHSTRNPQQRYQEKITPERMMEELCDPRPIVSSSRRTMESNVQISDSTSLFVNTHSSPRASKDDSSLSSPEIKARLPQLSLSHLTLPLLKKLLSIYESHDDQEFLFNTIRNVFSSVDSLKKSFLNERKISASQDQDPPQRNHEKKSTVFLLDNLNLEDIRQCFSLLMTYKDIVQSTLMDAIEILVASLRLQVNDLSIDTLRVFVILLENPFLRDPNYSVLHKKFLRLFLLLNPVYDETFALIFERYDREGFVQLLEYLQNYLGNHEYSSAKVDEAVKAVVKIIDMMHCANSRSSAKIVDYTYFYNDLLAKKLNFKEEYKRWKKEIKSDGFAFFKYPYLFDPVAKNRIIHIDAMVQMSQEYEDAFVHSALMFQAQKFLQDSPQAAYLQQSMSDATNPYLILDLRRDFLIRDCFAQLSNKEVDLKKPLKVRFSSSGEEGLDQGGVQKEFFQVIFHTLMDPSFGVFDYDADTRLSWFQESTDEQKPAKIYELVGILFGLALYNGVIIDVHVPQVLYKKLLHQPLSVSDLKDIYPAVHQSLCQLLDYAEDDIEDVFGLSFEITREVNQRMVNVALKPEGSTLAVHRDNRQEFCDLYAKYLLVEAVCRPYDSFHRGFHKVCGGDALTMCRSEELELLLIGHPEFDFHALEQVCQYDDSYHKDHPIIRWFWEIAHAYDASMKQKLLTFVTASDRVPLKGLGDVTFVIQRNGPDADRLPTALTCFSRLLLPEYSSRDRLKAKLDIAIMNAKGFGLV